MCSLENENKRACGKKRVRAKKDALKNSGERGTEIWLERRESKTGLGGPFIMSFFVPS